MKAKKTSKISENERNVRAVIAMLILAVAFGVFILFSNYQESVSDSGMLLPFVSLVFLGMGLLLTLLYLVNRESSKKKSE